MHRIYVFHKLFIFDQGCPNLARRTQADPRRDPGGRFRIFDKMCTFFSSFYRKITSKVARCNVPYLSSSIYVLDPVGKFGDFWWIFENLTNNRFFRGNFTRLVWNDLFLSGCSGVFFRKVVQNCPKLSKLGKKVCLVRNHRLPFWTIFCPFLHKMHFTRYLTQKTDLENFEKNPKKRVCPL